MLVKKYTAYTEEDIKQFVALWPTHSSAEIAKKLERTPVAMGNLANLIRSAGYNLPKKTKQGTINIIKRALEIN